MNPIQNLNAQDLKALQSLFDSEGFESLVKLLSQEQVRNTINLFGSTPGPNDTANLNFCRGFAFVLNILNNLKPAIEAEEKRRNENFEGLSGLKITDMNSFFPHPNTVFEQLKTGK